MNELVRYGEPEQLQKVAALIQSLRDAIWDYEHDFEPGRFTENAAPSLKTELNDCVDSIETRLQEIKEIERSLPDPMDDPLWKAKAERESRPY